MIRPILSFPDPRLRIAAAPVTAFDDDLRSLAADLLATMRAAFGIGITAPHVGVSVRLVVIDLSDAVRNYVNPQIAWAAPEMIRHEEGSVSMPGVREQVDRHAAVRVRYQDSFGTEHEAQAEGLLSVCLQHEIDQLDGIFWIQRLSRLKRDRVVKRFEKLQR